VSGVADAHELSLLAGLPLEELNLSRNPIATVPRYRISMVRLLPSLQTLDGFPVSGDKHAAAQQQQQQLQQQQLQQQQPQQQQGDDGVGDGVDARRVSQAEFRLPPLPGSMWGGGNTAVGSLPAVLSPSGARRTNSITSTQIHFQAGGSVPLSKFG
jgi:hypothetical protein